MRIGFVLVALAVGGCATPPSKPATLGLTVDEYRLQCPFNGMKISESDGLVIGECEDKPGEYVEFRGGRIATIMSSSEMGERLAKLRCKEEATFASCREQMLQFTAEHESRKAEAGRAARKAETDLVISNIQFGPGSAEASPTKNSSDSFGAGMMCFFQNDFISGQNKICNYDCLGSLTPVVQSTVSICPLSIKR